MVDNVFDRINLYPLAVLNVVGNVAIAGREAQYVADYRRERTYFQQSAAAINQGVLSDLGVGNSAIADSIWIDRGHNLWGKNVNVEGTPDMLTWTHSAGNNLVPAQGTVGGDPTAGWSVTEEGALYKLFAAWPARRGFRVYISESWQPIITGVIMGQRVQLSSTAGWSSIRDEDARERSDRNEASLVPGYEGYDRTYSARSLELRLAMIGAAEYDSTIRGLARTLFEVNQPAVVAINYGTSPERAWLYKYRGKGWSSPMTKAYRNVSIPLFEYGPLIR